MKTGNTLMDTVDVLARITPQWSPVMKTGNTSVTVESPPESSSLNGARS